MGAWVEDARVESMREVLECADLEGVALHLGMEPALVRIPASIYATWGIDAALVDAGREVEVRGVAEGVRLLCVRGQTPRALMRRVVLGAFAQHPETCVWWLWHEPTRLTLAVADARPDGRPMIRWLVWEQGSATTATLERWLALGAQHQIDAPRAALRWRQHAAQALDQEGLTRAFFERFVSAHRLLCATMRGGPEDEGARHDVALVVLLRLIVLTMLQARGVLDGDARFMWRRAVALATGEDGAGEVYARLIRPLCFGVLNRPAEARDADAQALGQIPFLNGGLFEPTPTERAHPALGWPDRTIMTTLQEVFERHRFALSRGEGADEECAVDPELLGKVFEGVMRSSERQQTGSFYTPRDVVARLVERALSGWLAARLGCGDAQAEALARGEEVGLSEADRARLAEALETFAALDPAVGTGAFLLELLRRLDALYTIALGPAEGAEAYARMRHIIHAHLFGVDVHPTAVRLCELRLWLALLARAPELSAAQMEPLPNLGHRVVQGDSLIDPLDRVALRHVLAPTCGEARQDVRESVAAITRLQESLLVAHGAEKRRVHQQLDELERALAIRLVAHQRDAVQAEIASLEAVEQSVDLFGAPVALPPEAARRLDRLRAARAEADRALDDITSDRRSGAAFSYPLRFARVMARGGFDLVLTNPPWVRASRIAPAARAFCTARYASADPSLWPDAAACGVQATFGAQADLSTFFIERALELLRPGGQLAALVPAKLLRGLHGAATRGVMAAHDLIAIEDFSEADRELFDATTYPAILHLQRRAEAPTPSAERRAARISTTECAIWRGATRTQWQTSRASLFGAARDARGPWLLVEPDAAQALDRVRAAGPRLGELEGLRPRRGVMTGHNAAFMLDPADARAAFGDDLDRWTRPALRGRDVRAWSATASARLLWPCAPDTTEPYDDLPAPLAAHLEPHRDALTRRSDMRPGMPFWRLFRAQDGLLAPKVVWRDLAPHLQAAPMTAEVVPLNTAYYLPLPDEIRAFAAAALLNSAPARAYTSAIAERARGQWRRHFAWVLCMLPVPEAFARWLSGEREDAGLADLFATLRQAPDPQPLADAFFIEQYGLSARALPALRACWGGDAPREEVAA